ncbi:hypothetical protein WJX72_005381 [[Myrmecia] bisecta]|uniref:Uncharacterized protein n=1 Tax=[Myrmecia] bisecta TaxID=41462 RepID=A0AAW1PXV1_9CHLO
MHSASGAKHLANTWVNLQVLRKRLQCALPVELVHNGPEEVPDDKRKLFEGEFTNIRFVDASLVPIPSHHRQTKLESYVIKVHALYITSFDEVLMLDSDNMPLADPSSLFDTPAYQAFGNLHWPDFANDIGKPLDPNIFRLLGLRIPWRAETGFRAEESGQLLINKARHADVLEYLLFLNLHSHIIYDYMWGDKDSVRIAYALAGKEGLRQQVQWTPRMALADHDGGGKGGDAASRKLLVGVIQHDPDARLVLMHRVTPGAKFDPDRKPYMKVDYITTPAGPDEFWATEWQAESKWGGTHEWRPESVDVTTPLTACPGEPFKCDLVDGTAGLLGIPIAWFEDLQQTLHFSYQAFRSYRKRLPATVKTHVRARKHGTDGIVVPNR